MKSIRILPAIAILACVLTAAEPLTNQIIIRMVQSGLPAETIVSTIRSADSFQFSMLTGDLMALEQAKVPDEVIKAMAAKLKGAAPAPTAPATVAGPENGAAQSRRAEFHRAELYGGYAYASMDLGGYGSRQNVNGWQTSATINITNRFGIEGDVGGFYKSLGNVDGFDVSIHDYVYAGGPRINWRPVFFHALFGIDRFTGGITGDVAGTTASLTASQNNPAGLFGGGVELKIGRNWFLRPSADYFVTLHRIPSEPRSAQHNLRIGGGIVYAFGRSR